MFISRRLIVAASAVALLAGCATPNPYDNQGQASSGTGMSKTATYGGLGALAGAVAGAALHDIEPCCAVVLGPGAAVLACVCGCFSHALLPR